MVFWTSDSCCPTWIATPWNLPVPEEPCSWMSCCNVINGPRSRAESITTPNISEGTIQNPLLETGGFCQRGGNKNPAEYKCQKPKQTPSPDRQSTQASWQETPRNKSWLLPIQTLPRWRHSLLWLQWPLCSPGEHCCCRSKNSTSVYFIFSSGSFCKC